MMQNHRFVIEAFRKVTSKKEAAEHELAALNNAEFLEAYNERITSAERFNKFRMAIHDKYSACGSRELYDIKPNSGGKFHVPIYCDVDLGTAYVETTREESEMYQVMDSQRIASLKQMQKLEHELRAAGNLSFSLVNVLKVAEELEKEHKAMLARMTPDLPPATTKPVFGRRPQV